MVVKYAICGKCNRKFIMQDSTENTPKPMCDYCFAHVWDRAKDEIEMTNNDPFFRISP